MRFIRECKTEEEKQELRDSMLEHMYHQVLGIRSEVSDIYSRLRRIEQKLVYVGATEDERKYINVDGSIKLDAINDMCDGVLALFGDKYVKEVIEDGKNEGQDTVTEVARSNA